MLGSKREKTMRLIAVIMWTILAGCAGQPLPGQPPPAQPPSATQPKINLAGYPLEFRQGYVDGCASAQLSAGRKRDEARFKSPVSEAMTSKLDKVQVKDPITRLMPIFDRGHIAIVEDGEKFLGLITRYDLLNYLRRRVQ